MREREEVPKSPRGSLYRLEKVPLKGRNVNSNYSFLIEIKREKREIP